MPRIFAETEEVGFFGLGYAQAEDRLEQILRYQLMIEGRLGELAAPEAALSDAMARRWHHREEAQLGFARMPQHLRDWYRAFIAGVEWYMHQHPDQVPAWAPRLEPWLPTATLRMLLWGYAIGDALMALDKAGIRAEADVDVLRPNRLPTDRSPQSNEWVLLPGRTREGAAVILSDPHGTIEGFQMWEFLLEAGRLKCTGVTYCGGCLPVLGCTAQLAWAYTTGAPRVSDVYRLPADGWTEVKLNGITSPVVARRDGWAYAICTPYMHVPELMDIQLHDWLLASNVASFRDAMRAGGQFPQNVMVADVHGDAWYVRAGRVPIRDHGLDPSLPLDGADPKSVWLGIHPLEDLLQVANPDCGYMQNCNCAPDTVAPGFVPRATHGYMFHDRPGRLTTRGRRALELLDELSEATIADALQVALDDTWPGWEPWIGALATALAGADVPTEWRKLAEPLLGFDGRAASESVAALLYQTWREQVGDREVATAVESLGPLGREMQHRLLDALSRTGTALKAAYGERIPAYGDVHRIGSQEESYPMGGGQFLAWAPDPPGDYHAQSDAAVQPLRLMVFDPPDEDGIRWATAGGRSLRLTALGDTVETYTAVLLGQGGRPGSPHRYDQARLAGERRTRRVVFGRAAAEAEAESRRQLTHPGLARSG